MPCDTQCSMGGGGGSCSADENTDLRVLRGRSI